MTASARNVRILQAAGALMLVLFSIWAGTRFYSTRSAAPVAVRTPVGEASPPLPSDFDASFADPAPPGAKIPERLPEFSLADTAGKTTSISRWAGKSLILNFWATWCAPCRREIPLLKALGSEWSGRDVEVVGIAVDYRDKVVAYASELKIEYPLLVGEGDALDVVSQFGIDTPAFPFTVFTDKHGQVVTLYLGELHRPQANLILSVVQKVNQEHMALAEARRSIADGLHALASSRPG